jgi:hypothetical protein
MSTQKLVNFVSKDKSLNIFMVLLLTFNFSLWLAIIIIKTKPSPSGEEDELIEALADSRADFMKLFLVWGNVFMLGLLLFQKKVLINGATWLKLLFGSFLVGLNIAALINLGILIKISLNLEAGQGSVLPYNYDWLTLGITCFTDIAYFIFYFVFKSTRGMLITAGVIIAEIIIYAVCVKLSSDVGVDAGNATVALITASMAIVLWSGKVELDEQGNPKEFKDFLLRDDLVEMEIMVHSDMKA